MKTKEKVCFLLMQRLKDDKLCLSALYNLPCVNCISTGINILSLIRGYGIFRFLVPKVLFASTGGAPGSEPVQNQFRSLVAGSRLYREVLKCEVKITQLS